MNKKWLWDIIVLFVMLFCLIALPACDVTPADYNKYTQLEGDVRFSLEYPKIYESINTDIYPGYTMVAFSHPQEGEDMGGWVGDSWVVVDVFKAGLNYSDARALMEYDIVNISTRQDFQLVDKSSLNIDGIVGEQRKGSFEMSHQAVFEGYDKPLNTTTYFFFWSVYFDYCDYIWSISIISVGQKTAKFNEPRFEHMLETFKILD